ncbi:MAG: cell envelope integrity protein CreD [Verrucomicrobiota bacterium]
MKEKATFIIKIAVVSMVALVLLIPLAMIENLVDERAKYRLQAMRSVSISWSDSQTLIGPILVVPYTKTLSVQEWNEKKRIETTKTVTQQHYLYLPPESLSVSSDIITEQRYKGIYTFPVYRTDTRLSGSFKIQGLMALFEQNNIQFRQNPYLVMGISDPGGIRSDPSLKWNARTVHFESGCPSNVMQSGIHAELPKFTAYEEGRNIRFELDLKLQGMGNFQVAPIGRSITVDYQSNWPHPSFIGPYPTARSQIDEKGFKSVWEISHFATNLGETFNTNKAANFDHLGGQAIGVQLINPVDVYQITDRSLKYSFLFVALTFVVFFLYEILKQLKIHPVQYGLVGIALALFFLLLLSLSEHIAFHWAYMIAATACVGLLTYYVAYVLESLLMAAGFNFLLTAIYGTLYSLLQLEDLALLAGSVLLFIVLSIIMIITRKFDWYQLSRKGDNFGQNAQDPPPLPTVGKATF